MIREFTDVFIKNKQKVIDCFREEHPSYTEIIKAVVSNMYIDGKDCPDPDRIHEICDGEYQGKIVFVIAARGYQPYEYWYSMVDYGSCEGCDILMGIRNYGYNVKPTEKQLEEYYLLALHLAQKLKKMSEDT